MNAKQLEQALHIETLRFWNTHALEPVGTAASDVFRLLTAFGEKRTILLLVEMLKTPNRFQRILWSASKNQEYINIMALALALIQDLPIYPEGYTPQEGDLRSIGIDNRLPGEEEDPVEYQYLVWVFRGGRWALLKSNLTEQKYIKLLGNRHSVASCPLTMSDYTRDR